MPLTHEPFTWDEMKYFLQNMTFTCILCPADKGATSLFLHSVTRKKSSLLGEKSGFILGRGKLLDREKYWKVKTRQQPYFSIKTYFHKINRYLTQN